MSKFRFRLATLQKLREAYRDQMRLKLAEAYQAERLLEQQIRTLREEDGKLQEHLRSMLETRNTDVNKLLNAQRYGAVLKGQQATLQNQSQMLAVELEKRRLALVGADQQVRALEKLHARQADAHRTKSLRAEAKVMDEIASRVREGDL